MENALTMLHHEEQNDPAPPPGQAAGVPAAQVRVTAEEFARAVARHQARREEAAQHLQGTVSLGDAVQELNIDITPEELLAEVQAARAEQSARAVPQTPRRPRLGLAVAGGSLLLVMSFGLLRTTGPFTAQSPPTAVTTPAQQNPSVVSIAAPGTTLVQDTRGGSPVLRTLQELPDGVPGRCSLTQTDGHTTFTDFSNPNASWTLVKYDGQVYVRGWIPNMSAQAMQAGGVTLYEQKALVPSGAAPRPVSLRLDRIQSLPGQGDDEMIVAQKVQTDGHFGDRW